MSEIERQRDAALIGYNECRATIEDARRVLGATAHEGLLLAAMRVTEQRDRLAEALDVCLREMLDVIYACNEEIVDANDTFHQAIKLGQKTLDDVKGGSDD
jgi:hypothetical protein